MRSTEIEFADLHLANPIVIAACPATESVSNILKCAEAGAGAVITKSISRYEPAHFPLGHRRMHVGLRGLWATSAYRRETLPLAAGCRLIEDARKYVSLPIIGSVTALDDKLDSWLPTCLALQDSGADAIQLDFFYLPCCVAGADRPTALHALVAELSMRIKIPVIPKLNVEIPAMAAVNLFSDTGISGVSLLDSVRVPPPLSLEPNIDLAFRYINHPTSASLFGSWQLPLTLHYTHILSTNAAWPLCVGGGIMDTTDAVYALLCGGRAVQVATCVLVHGFKRITELVTGIESYLGARDLPDLSALHGRRNSLLDLKQEPSFVSARAFVDLDDCNRCASCLDLTFCNAIHSTKHGPTVEQQHCDGCAACTYYCPTGAIKIGAA